MPAPDRRTRATLYRGGAVHSPADPSAQAMLVVGDTVGWLGSDDASVRHVDAADEVVDLDGGLVTPAFVDAHAHTTETGLALSGVDLSRASSAVDALARVEAAARSTRGRVLGHGWDERGWPEQRPPTRHELDRAAGGRPVYLARVDVHSAVVSTALADQHGLRDLPGWSDEGRIERDAHHAARALTREGIDDDERRRLQEAALAAAAAAGIGSLHEMSAPHIAPPRDLGGLLTLVEQVRRDPGRAAVPDVVAYRGALVADAAEVAAVLAGLELPDGVRLAGLAGDLCADGSVGSRTAAMREPYADADTCGHAYLTAEQVRDHLVTCTRAGLQGGFHVIGDAAVDAIVTGLRMAAEIVGRPAMRAAGHRLEHVELVDAEAVEVLADLAVTASVQPAFDAAWGGGTSMYAERLGVARALAMNPLADLSGAGVALAFGSDCPVTPFDPWGGVAAAAFHHNPQQRIGIPAAFLAHTRGPWRAAGSDVPGVLAVGAPATYAVWAASDRTAGLPDLSPSATRPRCLRTAVAGRIAFDAL